MVKSLNQFPIRINVKVFTKVKHIGLEIIKAFDSFRMNLRVVSCKILDFKPDADP